ncbi:MAG: phospho-N-acetylmuramoyl-pentapeptide-transferase, partial [Elusimicrobia bacterium]|nr:phospho-N-acetylmuramoyl-pentapeptide-transferase [Elusimicrobiota bacterium]
MLYYLSFLREHFSYLNIFQYITFRTGGAVITAFLLSLILGPAIIAKLQKYKIEQIQRAHGPISHLSKSGTPTMGGVIILIALVSTVLLWARLDSRFVWLLLWTTALLAAIGIYDDYTKLVKRNPAGAPSWFKLAFQLVTAVTVTAYLSAYPPNPA